MKIPNLRINTNTPPSDTPSLDESRGEALKSGLKSFTGRVSTFAKTAPRQALGALKNNIYKYEGNQQTQGAFLDGAADVFEKGVGLLDRGKAMSSKAKEAIKKEIFKFEGNKETQGTLLDGAADLFDKGVGLLDRGKAMSSKAENAIKKEINKGKAMSSRAGNAIKKEIFKFEGNKETQGTLLDGAADVFHKGVGLLDRGKAMSSKAGNAIKKEIFKYEGNKETQGKLLDGAADLIDMVAKRGAQLRKKMSGAGSTSPAQGASPAAEQGAGNSSVPK